MSVTLADFYQRTGMKLGIVRAEENLAHEDGALIAQYYVGLHDQLMTHSLATWAVTDELPEWAVPIVSDMLAALLVDEFGLQEPRRTSVRGEGILDSVPVSPAERKLRRQLSPPYISNVVQTEQF